MNRLAGFAVMDVSTSILDDPKFRRIQRQAPELVATAFTAYLATMAESWRAGKRVSIDDAWPSILIYDAAADNVLREVGLLDAKGLPNSKAWRSWFQPAFQRRETLREKWRRANENRRDDAAPEPPGNRRGNSGGTAAPVPSAPSVRPVPSEPSVPPVGARGARDDDGLTTPLTREEERRALLEKASEDFKHQRITLSEYQRIRQENAA
jgi:hypothetical protein